MLVVFTRNPITIAANEYIEMFKLYKQNEISEERLEEAQEKYQRIVAMYKWVTE